MARFYSASGIEKLTLEAAAARNLTWDVFVSHTTSDHLLAGEVASCIKSFGLTAWVDSEHFAPDDDGPSMASKIKDVIGRSYSLMAVVTTATSNSWWVPFEVGVASEKERYLSTYGKTTVSLPSFLEAWLRVIDHNELHVWCIDVKQKKAKHPPLIEDGVVKMASSQQLNYASEMRAMANRFPGAR